MGPLYLGKMGNFANFRYINNLAVELHKMRYFLSLKLSIYNFKFSSDTVHLVKGTFDVGIQDPADLLQGKKPVH